uniref:Uncharacterized protein n=1 Tax=Cacopsylla melanoneura TaxID=428564 RepID=A0A8D9F9M8_9HEMI
MLDKVPVGYHMCEEHIVVLIQNDFLDKVVVQNDRVDNFLVEYNLSHHLFVCQYGACYLCVQKHLIDEFLGQYHLTDEGFVQNDSFYELVMGYHMYEVLVQENVLLNVSLEQDGGLEPFVQDELALELATEDYLIEEAFVENDSINEL